MKCAIGHRLHDEAEKKWSLTNNKKPKIDLGCETNRDIENNGIENRAEIDSRRDDDLRTTR